MLSARKIISTCCSKRLPIVTTKLYLFQRVTFSTSTILSRGGAAKYKSKRTKLPADKRIKTPEELFESASNVDIENLRKNVEERTELRYITPNKLWMSKVFPNLKVPKTFTYYDDHSNRAYVKNQLIQKFGDIKTNFKWKDLQYFEIAVGDVVDLSGNFEKGDLSVIIELPKSPDDPRYTLLNAYGEIQFVSRSKMGVRIPGVFPKAWFENCVLEESQFWENLDIDEIVPVGKPKYKLEDVVDRNKIFESAIARSISSETAAKTYILPSLLSGVISETLTHFVTTAWEVLPDINIKLEVLHNVLQSNESPIQITLYQLYRALELTDIQVLIREFKSQKPDDVNKGYKKLLSLISNKLSIDNQYDSISLGKEIKGIADLDMEVDLTKFYGFILSLRKNNQLYSHDAFANASTYVLVLPLSRIVNLNGMVQAFKENEKLHDELAKVLSRRLKGKPLCNDDDLQHILPYYHTFVDLLKLYCAGSIQNSVLESFVIKIMRILPGYKDLDITSSSVYDLLLNTGEIDNAEGPAKWADNAMIPYSGISIKCDYEQDFYNSIVKDNVQDYVDMENELYPKKRTLFNDVVYCIDSKDPLEIDDGISIKALNDKEYLVSTFVADPSSYLNPNSLISRIAFERGLTLYLPELSGTNSVSLLLTGFSESTQLGYCAKQTRTLKISFKYNCETKQVIELDDKEIISFGLASNFIKIDYDSVNDILLDKPSALETVKSCIQSSKIMVEQVVEDLKSLSKVSRCLNEVAMSNGRVGLFDQTNYKKEIEHISESKDKQIQLTFKDTYNDDTVDSLMNEAKSEELVSEIMVMANNIAGKFFAKHNIPAIYKIQTKLEMSPEIKQFADEITTKKNSSFKELTLYQEYLTKSTIAPFPYKHEFLNIDHYATVTSPLRRFWDLINHWQLHAFLSTGKPMFDQQQMNYMALHLKYKDEINTKFSNKVRAFYTFKALRYLQEHQNTNEKYMFRAVVTKKPSESGLIDVTMLDYGVRCILETNWYALSDNKDDLEKRKASTKNIEIGDIIDDTYIKDIDLVEGSIVLKSESI
ncbi:hypothetical protein CANINC_001177 [Pichia inconspicua]|uniref:RNB domain-containing protein n=1 Tax=Pichia inconspicua TaxID=52247 RepID=A0A4T0X5M0_9ASCO|nr:hypothetical protein CANINC_001177 [[Candida] inconspicua]